MNNIIKKFPKKRPELPSRYQKIYDRHYIANRTGSTSMSSVSSRLEAWMHVIVAATSGLERTTLEIGAGNLNQLEYERNNGVYDVIEPNKVLMSTSKRKKEINNIYDDISDIPISNRYHRIISIACFEHICTLPDVIQAACTLMAENGFMCVSIPNEGRFLWKLAYTCSTGLEFKLKYGLNYEKLMNYEHVNTADEIEEVLKLFFNEVEMKLFGFNKTFALYRYYLCRRPKLRASTDKSYSSNRI